VSAALYLIGVNHAVQFDPVPPFSEIFQESTSVRDKRVAFRGHVSETIEKLGVEIVVEEFNEEAKRKRGLHETTLEHFSKIKGIDHRFCEPGREEMWLSQIEGCKNRRVLFVCGDDHFDSFSETLVAAGFEVEHGPRYRITDEEFLGL
jgi:hypothetical protein